MTTLEILHLLKRIVGQLDHAHENWHTYQTRHTNQPCDCTKLNDLIKILELEEENTAKFWYNHDNN